jgi:hypothetical protein
MVPRLKTLEAKRELRSVANLSERLASWAQDVEANSQPPRQTSVSDPGFTVSIDPLNAAELKVDETYDSWRCQQCHAVLALARRAPHADPRDLPNAIILLKCPHCGARRHYTMHERLVRRYPWNAKTAHR